MKIGFIGLGVMGQPMALNLARSGISLMVWNRSPEKYPLLEAAGATIATNPTEIFRETQTVILMLANEAAIDSVLERHTPAFEVNIRHCTIVHMGTTSADYSQKLEADILAAGGHYVEAPVSGSRKPAEQGELISMLAGEPEFIEAIRPLLLPMCHKAFYCGPVPNALLMKLSINLFLITQVTGLAEAFHFAHQQGLDLNQFTDIVNSSPMASSVSRIKAQKLLEQNFEVQASITDVLKNNRLIAEAARDKKIASPLLDACHALFSETNTLGHHQLDMAAVIHAIEARTHLITLSN